MTAYGREQFAETVAMDYARRQYARQYAAFSQADAVYGALEHKALGHPQTEGLEVGERRTLPMTVAFLDLTNFTRRTFWDELDDVVDLAHAVLTGFIETVDRFGGHPLGLRGDGLFAGFGGERSFASAMALSACALALDAVQNGVNPWLDAKGMEHIQARAGLDSGNISFVRTGNDNHSEVNALGFAANFAAKCEKVADSWEIVVGEGVHDALPAYPYFTPHAGSPKVYERLGERKYYRFYNVSWRRALPHLGQVPEELAGTSTSQIRSS